MHDDPTAVQAGAIQLATCGGHVVRIRIDGVDEQLRPLGQFKGQPAVATAQIDAIPFRVTGVFDIRLGGSSECGTFPVRRLISNWNVLACR